jgi:hypothetical protein
MEGQQQSLERLLLEQGRVSAEDLRKVRRLQQERASGSGACSSTSASSPRRICSLSSHGT